MYARDPFCVVDLLVAFISVMTDIIWRITEHWYAGAAMCKIIRYLQVPMPVRAHHLTPFLFRLQQQFSQLFC